LKYFDRARISVILTSSDGCMVNPPTLIHRWDPFVTDPATKTAMSRTMASAWAA